MRKVYVIEEYTARRLEEQINYLLDHEEIKVINIQYQTAGVPSSTDTGVDGEINIGGNVYHTALVEYEVHEKGVVE